MALAISVWWYVGGGGAWVVCLVVGLAVSAAGGQADDRIEEMATQEREDTSWWPES